MADDSGSTEKGIKWWIRYVVVPLIGSGGIIAILGVVLPVILAWPKSTENPPLIPPVTVVVTPRILVSSDYGKLLYEENFDKDDETWSLEQASIIKDGSLVLQPNTSSSPYSDNQYSDFIFETAFKQISPSEDHPGIAIYLRQQIPHCPGWNCSIQIWASGSWKSLGARKIMGDNGITRILGDTSAPLLSPTDWNKLTVIATGDLYQIFVNGVLVSDVSDSTYKTGKFAFSSSAPAVTAIDYVRVYALP